MQNVSKPQIKNIVLLNYKYNLSVLFRCQLWWRGATYCAVFFVDASVSFETALSADYGDECVGRRSSLVDVKTRASSSSSSLQMPKMPLLCSGNGIRSDRLRMKAIVASMQTNRMTVLLKRIKWK